MVDTVNITDGQQDNPYDQVMALAAVGSELAGENFGLKVMLQRNGALLSGRENQIRVLQEQNDNQREIIVRLRDQVKGLISVVDDVKVTMNEWVSEETKNDILAELESSTVKFLEDFDKNQEVEDCGCS